MHYQPDPDGDYRERDVLNNRQRAKSARAKRGGWCEGCDAAVVDDGARCPKCGLIAGGYRRKRLPRSITVQH